MKYFTPKIIWYKLLKKISKKSRLKLRYYKKMGKWPNIDKPTEFNEKILNRMLYNRNIIYTELSDKLRVRIYIKKMIGEQYLIPLIHSTNDEKTLLSISDWSNIVIKPNHLAGRVKIIDKNPNMNEKNNIINESKKWLKINYSKKHDEQHYSKIKPCLLVEKKITAEKIIPRDFKFHCFRQKSGEIIYVLQLIDGRFSKESIGYYYNNLDECKWVYGLGNCHLSQEEKIQLKKIIELNKKLINHTFDYVRIDWYIVDSKIYFGELTFTSGAGVSNKIAPELQSLMGKLWISDKY